MRAAFVVVMVVLPIVITIVIFMMMPMIIVVMMRSGIVMRTSIDLMRTMHDQMAIIRTKAAGIQPGQYAKDHQPCENRFHQVGGDSTPFIANSRKNSLLESGRRSCTS